MRLTVIRLVLGLSGAVIGHGCIRVVATKHGDIREL